MSRGHSLHPYMSANGNGFCGYEEFGVVCGQTRGHASHLSEGEKISSHQYTPPLPGTLGEESGACSFVRTNSPGACGAKPESHVGKRPAADPVGDYLAEKAGWAHETYHGAQFPVDSPPTTAQVVAMFHDHALRLAVAKEQTYAKAWVRQGYMGNVARVLSKVERLRNMVWRDQQADLPPEVAAPTDQEEETLRDTLLDLANLCAFAAHNISEGNRWGDGRGN